jgi:hypothetical protein
MVHCQAWLMHSCFGMADALLAPTRDKGVCTQAKAAYSIRSTSLNEWRQQQQQQQQHSKRICSDAITSSPWIRQLMATKSLNSQKLHCLVRRTGRCKQQVDDLWL